MIVSVEAISLLLLSSSAAAAKEEEQFFVKTSSSPFIAEMEGDKRRWPRAANTTMN